MGSLKSLSIFGVTINIIILTKNGVTRSLNILGGHLGGCFLEKFSDRWLFQLKKSLHGVIKILNNFGVTICGPNFTQNGVIIIFNN